MSGTIVASRTAPSRVPFVSTLTRDLDEMQNRLRRAFNLPSLAPFLPALAEPLGWTPAVEVAESPKEFTVTAELPGLAAGDVTADFENGTLTIRGKKTETKREKDSTYYVWERGYGAFERSFAFPTPVKREGIRASFENGILTVTLPKAGEARGNGGKIAIVAR